MSLPQPPSLPFSVLLLLLAALACPIAALASPARVGPFRWPLDGIPQVMRPFQPPATPYGPGHRGVDLLSSAGAVVRSAAPGVVTFAGPVGGRGVLVVAHADGLRTTYEPVVATARVGMAVRAGDPIGRLVPGHRGCGAQVCLHWGLRRGQIYLDPLALLGRAPVRLWPLEPGDTAGTGIAPAGATAAPPPRPHPHGPADAGPGFPAPPAELPSRPLAAGQGASSPRKAATPARWKRRADETARSWRSPTALDLSVVGRRRGDPAAHPRAGRSPRTGCTPGPTPGAGPGRSTPPPRLRTPPRSRSRPAAVARPPPS